VSFILLEKGRRGLWLNVLECHKGLFFFFFNAKLGGMYEKVDD
jgi:hypothetical protein